MIEREREYLHPPLGGLDSGIDDVLGGDDFPFGDELAQLC